LIFRSGIDLETGVAFPAIHDLAINAATYK